MNQASTKKMTPGDDMHLTLLMAPHNLNLVTGQDRQHLLAFGRAAFEAGQKCQGCDVPKDGVYQISEPMPADKRALMLSVTASEPFKSQLKECAGRIAELEAQLAAAQQGVQAAAPVDAVEAVTKAILFEDAGSTYDWESNTNLGLAAIKAHGAMDAEHWAELHRLRAEVKRSDGAPWQAVAAQDRAECNRLRAMLAASTYPAESVSAQQAMEALKAAMKADPEYAWSWHCAICAGAHDEGLETGAANRAAARVMNMAFDCDTTKNANFHAAHLAATHPTPQGLDADMFWDADDPERCESSINNVVVEAYSYRGLKVGDIVTILRAARLPGLEVRVTQVPDAEGNGDLEWDVIDAAQAKQGGA
ncbi:hypothetical protein B5M06_14975 [Comamonas kerstersii]|uniref:Uncharacterized protein n=2 Tax=Comamonas kerstersii TaxID=225992 RepID=A0A1V0BHF3_9BURK|nr:hypothetical protein B5M06_14975 [Comamonas kerstersii]